MFLLAFFFSTCIRLGLTTVVKGINVQYRTQAEIRAYVSSDKGAKLDDRTLFSSNPSYSEVPFSPGTIHVTSLQSALNMLNQVRYISGIENDVTLNDEYNTMAQAAALVNRVNEAVSHSPKQPVGMDKDLYDLGYKGSQYSNLLMGFYSLGSSIVKGWMKDDSGANLNTAGHRRFILNPRMEQTGFGMVGISSAMYTADMRRNSSSYYGIPWPAFNMPIEYFGSSYPWTLSMGWWLNISDVNVKLTRLSDGHTWEFSESSDSSVGFFNVDNQHFGMTGAIIFRPNGIAYEAGDVFDVSVTGLKNPVSYRVNFFSLEVSTTKDPSAAVVHRVSFASVILLSVFALWLFL